MFASPSFDVSLSDIGLPLAFGAAMCPVPYEVLSSPNRFRAFLTALNVTIADITPTYLRLFNGAELPSVRVLVTGGEAPFPADVEIYAARHHYFNAYGPTENTITSTMSELRPGGAISAGRPLANTSVYVCDAEGNPVPPGATGELWLGGASLARGYVGRPELTAAAFVDTSRGRLYRSGDLGRWRENGAIEILGRIDDQVKLNGIRIELGEIEHAIETHPDVAQAVALIDGYGTNHRLRAFVRLHPGTDAVPEVTWREYLSGRLPAYMIPAAVIAVPEIPLSNSGKVDKAALKTLAAARYSLDEGELPLDGLETDIANLWRELLSCGAIHRNDNFFALGGHSLLAIALSHRLEETLGRSVPARELFAAPTLGAYARRVSELRVEAVSPPASSDRATEGQREFWIAEQAGLDTRGFIIPLAWAAAGAIPSDDTWRRVWTALVNRHEALRTAFYEDQAGVLRRSIANDMAAEFEISTQADHAAALAYARKSQAEPFAMANPPLWRAGLIHVASGEPAVFWLALHHSIGDGVSLGILVEELSTLLRGEPLPDVTAHFDESAGAEEAYLAGPACHDDARYWQNLLGNLGDRSPDIPQPFDEWPLDSPRPLGRTGQNARGAHRFQVSLDAPTAAGLRELARRNGATLHALMLTILAKEVWRRTRRPEFVLGTAASTRDSAGSTRVVGYYVNMLPVPCRVQRDESPEESLQAMQSRLADGLQHARYPFARMYRDFHEGQSITPHPARYPLFDIAVTENPAAAEPVAERGFHLRAVGAESVYELRTNAPAQDMVLVHEARPDGTLVLQWYVNAAIYEKETAKAWIDSLAAWARFLVDNNRIPGAPLPLLLPQETRVLSEWERGPDLPLPAPNFPALFEHWARVQPERPALVSEHGAQTYSSLNARSNALAHALLALGVSRQERVGVLADRSMALFEVVLAIWKAGACYLPLAKDLPDDRLAFIARDAGIRVLVALDGHEPPPSVAGGEYHIFRPETLSEEFVAAHQDPVWDSDDRAGSELAYIIYTSGSTGKPKGVMLHHDGLNNLGVALSRALDIRPDDRALLAASPAFDAWISDLAMAWSAGAAVVPVKRAEMDDIAGMRHKIARLGVSIATLPPSYLRLFEQAELPGVRTLMTVGEPPHVADALHYAERLRYINGYGPTENTAAASVGQVPARARRLTSGRPLANTTVHICDSSGEPVPPGSMGYVWLGGIGLASGYLNRPDLTTASFVDTPAGRRYRTGDLGRWTHTGELEIIGRADGQVKLRGQRIELGEIEYQLEQHPGVQQAVAAVETRNDGAQNLFAFVRLHANATEPTQAAWHEYLAATLPSYMLPSVVLRVQVIPVNDAGKVDRRALLRTIVDNEGQPRELRLQRSAHAAAR